MSDQFHSLRKAANFISRFQPDEDVCLQLADDLQWAATEIELLRSVVRKSDADEGLIEHPYAYGLTACEVAAARRALESAS